MFQGSENGPPGRPRDLGAGSPSISLRQEGGRILSLECRRPCTPCVPCIVFSLGVALCKVLVGFWSPVILARAPAPTQPSPIFTGFHRQTLLPNEEEDIPGCQDFNVCISEGHSSPSTPAQSPRRKLGATRSQYPERVCMSAHYHLPSVAACFSFLIAD